MDGDAMSLAQAQTRLIAAYTDFEKKLFFVIRAAFDLAEDPARVAGLMNICDSLTPGSPAQMVMSRMIFISAAIDAAPLTMPGYNWLRCLAREVPQHCTGDEQQAAAAAADAPFQRGDLASTAQDALFAGGDWDSSWGSVLRDVFRLRGDEAARTAQAEFDALERQAKSAAADVLEAAMVVLRCERPSVREETYYYPELVSWIHDRTSVLPPRVTCPVCLVSRVPVPRLDDLAAAAAGAADGDRQDDGGDDDDDEERPEKGVLLPCNTIVCDRCWRRIGESERARDHHAARGAVGQCPICRVYVNETKDLDEQLGWEFKILGSAP